MKMVRVSQCSPAPERVKECCSLSHGVGEDRRYSTAPPHTPLPARRTSCPQMWWYHKHFKVPPLRPTDILTPTVNVLDTQSGKYETFEMALEELLEKKKHFHCDYGKVRTKEFFYLKSHCMWRELCLCCRKITLPLSICRDKKCLGHASCFGLCNGVKCFCTIMFKSFGSLSLTRSHWFVQIYSNNVKYYY